MMHMKFAGILVARPVISFAQAFTQTTMRNKVLRFHLKSVRLCDFPYSRVDSVNCMLWFKPE